MSLPSVVQRRFEAEQKAKHDALAAALYDAVQLGVLLGEVRHIKGAELGLALLGHVGKLTERELDLATAGVDKILRAHPEVLA